MEFLPPPPAPNLPAIREKILLWRSVLWGQCFQPAPAARILPANNTPTKSANASGCNTAREHSYPSARIFPLKEIKGEPLICVTSGGSHEELVR
jgi:hypothetical protein